MDYLSQIIKDVRDEECRGRIVEAWNCLMKLGLTRRQAAVFLTLCIKGALTIREISNEIKMHAVAVHKTLKELLAYNLVDMLLGAPNRYVAKKPNEVARNILDYHLNKFNASKMYSELLKRSLEDVEKAFPLLEKKEDIRPSYKLIIGRKALYSEIIRLLNQTRREHFIIMSPYGVVRVVRHGLVDHYRGCVERGVNIKVISEVTELNVLEASYLDKVVEFRHLPNIQLRMNISDVDTMIISAICDDSDLSLHSTDEINLIIKDRFMCNGFKKIFLEMWKNSIDARKIINEIQRIER